MSLKRKALEATASCIGSTKLVGKPNKSALSQSVGGVELYAARSKRLGAQLQQRERDQQSHKRRSRATRHELDLAEAEAETQQYDSDGDHVFVNDDVGVDDGDGFYSDEENPFQVSNAHNAKAERHTSNQEHEGGDGDEEGSNCLKNNGPLQRHRPLDTRPLRVGHAFVQQVHFMLEMDIVGLM